LLELQALVGRASYGYPQRVASGFDPKRLALLLAILEKRQKLPFGDKDVFVNLTGGLRISEPALDLALVTALVSSLEEIAVRPDTVIIGEVGLGGEIRRVPNLERRLAEALRLGFARAVTPSFDKLEEGIRQKMQVLAASDISEALSQALS